MTIRTSEKTVTFRRPFFLAGFDETLPAGAYSVETDEELLEGVSFPAYRRVLTLIHLHATPDRPGQTRTLTVDPNELDAALARDQGYEKNSTGRKIGPEPPKEAAEPLGEPADR